MTNNPIPEGDRFKDDSLFRLIGTGVGDALYECWGSAIRKYVEKCVEAEREACAKVCDAVLEESNNIAASVCAGRIRQQCIKGKAE